MNELYEEILVKKKKTAADNLKKAGLIALTALFAFGGLFIFAPLMLAALAAGVASYFLMPALDLEYEYLYVDGDFDVDKIMSKQRRKKAGSYDLENLIILAPAGSHDLDPYKNGKRIDYTSGEDNTPYYVGVYSKESQKELVCMELTQTIINDIRRKAPRKVSRDCML